MPTNWEASVASWAQSRLTVSKFYFYLFFSVSRLVDGNVFFLSRVFHHRVQIEFQRVSVAVFFEEVSRCLECHWMCYRVLGCTLGCLPTDGLTQHSLFLLLVEEKLQQGSRDVSADWISCRKWNRREIHSEKKTSMIFLTLTKSTNKFLHLWLFCNNFRDDWNNSNFFLGLFFELYWQQ